MTDCGHAWLLSAVRSPLSSSCSSNDCIEKEEEYYFNEDNNYHLHTSCCLQNYTSMLLLLSWTDMEKIIFLLLNTIQVSVPFQEVEGVVLYVF